MRNLPGFSPMRLTLVLTLGFFIAVAVLAFFVTRSSGGDAQTASNTTSSSRQRVKVVLTGTERSVEEQTDGGIAGIGVFRATGAITDTGPFTTYRGLSTLNEGVILLRFVSKGRKGAITYLVRIDTTRRPVVSRWTIESGTKAYKGLHGKGIESENATYTISTLRGKVWH